MRKCRTASPLWWEDHGNGLAGVSFRWLPPFAGLCLCESMRTLPRLIAAISLSLLAFAVPPASAATTVKVLQLNICHSGVAGCYAGAEPVMAKAESVISSTRPQVVSVNEACSGDVDRLRTAMGCVASRRSWPPSIATARP